MRVLYLGIDPSNYVAEGEIVHYPIIRTVLQVTWTEELRHSALQCTHWLFTSPSAVKHWFSLDGVADVMVGKQIIALGAATATALKIHGFHSLVAEIPTQEGVIATLDTLSLDSAYLGWPHSSKARPLLAGYLAQKKIAWLDIDLYDTLPQKIEPLPDVLAFDEIVFTSPSTVDAFCEVFGPIPWDKRIVPIGPITAARLAEKK